MSSQEIASQDDVERSQSGELSDNEESLSDVSASLEDLIRDDQGRSLTFGHSLMDKEELDKMVRRNILVADQVRLPPEGEVNPKPKPNECVVFRDLFHAGLRFPCQDFIEDVLAAFNIEMHQLTPNGIVRLAQFIWAVRCQEASADISAFCELFEMHCQFKTKVVDGRVITKYFGCCAFKAARNAVQIAPAIRNKWDVDWPRYWFCHAAPLVEERDPVTKKIVKKYPLAASMKIEDFECNPVLSSSMISKTSVKAYKTTCNTQKLARI